MPTSSKTAAAYCSYAVNIAQRSPRSFIACRWWMRMRRIVSPARGEPYGDRPSASVMVPPVRLAASDEVHGLPPVCPKSTPPTTRPPGLLLPCLSGCRVGLAGLAPATRDREPAVAPEV